MRLVWMAVWVPMMCAQVVPDRYIVELKSQPALAGAGRRVVRAEQARMRPQLEGAGARVIASLETVANALIVEAPGMDRARLASLPSVARVHAVRLARPNLDHALELHKVPAAWAALGGNAGAGIKIGIIDSGIAQDHPAFQDPSLPMPPGFPLANQKRDLAYTTNKVIVARNYVNLATPQDSFGHGTAVAMEAAGVTNTGPLGAITGVAPKAWLGSYKVYQGEGSFGEDTVLEALEDAVNDGMDVINMSLGVAIAQRIPDDILVAAVERAAALGVVVSVAAGNLGGTPNTIASPATAPSAIAVGATANDRVFGPGAVRVSGTQAYFAIPGIGRSANSTVTAPVVDVAALDGTGDGCGPLAPNSLAGRIALMVRSPQSCSFAGKLMHAQDAGAAAAIVYMSPESPDVVAMNVGTSTLPAVSVNLASGVSLKNLLRDNAAPMVTIQFTTSAIEQTPNVMAPFSSRGPNADASIKPDLVATGMFVYTATQKTNPASFLYGATGYVREADGTSFAAPLVTGAAALLKAARPGLTAAQYRSLLVNSAAPVPFPIQWTGAGVLNVNAALQSTAAVSPVSLGFGTGPGTADVTRDLVITNVGTVDDTFAISLAPMGTGLALAFTSNTVKVAAGASQKVGVHLTGPSLSPGEYQGYVHIRSTQTTVDTVVPYWYGVPDRIPKYVAELEVPDVAFPGSVEEIYFRVTDLTGLPLPGAGPVVKAIGGFASVLRVTQEDGQSPGVFHATVQLGQDEGLNVFEIDVGPVSRRITIVGQIE